MVGYVLYVVMQFFTEFFWYNFPCTGIIPIISLDPHSLHCITPSLCRIQFEQTNFVSDLMFDSIYGRNIHASTRHKVSWSCTRGGGMLHYLNCFQNELLSPQRNPTARRKRHCFLQTLKSLRASKPINNVNTRHTTIFQLNGVIAQAIEFNGELPK